MIALLLACAKAPSVPEPPERDPPVAPGADLDVLYQGLGSTEADVRALAAGALVRRLPQPEAAGVVVVARASSHEVVHRAVVAGLQARAAEPWAETILVDIARTPGRDLVLRGTAALALSPAQSGWLAEVLPATPRSGAAVGLWLAGARAGLPGAREGLWTVLDEGTLPLEPALAWALAVVPGAVDDARLARAEAALLPHLHCAALLQDAPGALPRAIRNARASGDDAIDAWAGCPAPRSTAVLRALPGSLARYARVGRDDLAPSAALPVPGEGWPDRVVALARCSAPEAHVALAQFAAGADDAGREAVALALVGHALAGDSNLASSLRTDASLRTRVAVAAWSDAPLPGGPGR